MCSFEEIQGARELREERQGEKAEQEKRKQARGHDLWVLPSEELRRSSLESRTMGSSGGSSRIGRREKHDDDGLGRRTRSRQGGGVGSGAMPETTMIKVARGLLQLGRRGSPRGCGLEVTPRSIQDRVLGLAT